MTQTGNTSSHVTVHTAREMRPGYKHRQRGVCWDQILLPLQRDGSDPHTGQRGRQQSSRMAAGGAAGRNGFQTRLGSGGECNGRSALHQRGDAGAYCRTSHSLRQAAQTGETLRRPHQALRPFAGRRQQRGCHAGSYGHGPARTRLHLVHRVRPDQTEADL